MNFVSLELRKSARGRKCQLNIPGVCNENRETTVWAHCNSVATNKGFGIKSHDLFGCDACSACHYWLDQGRASKEDKESYFWPAMVRSLSARLNDGWRFANEED